MERVRNIYQIKPRLTTADAEVYRISPKLDYCNGLFSALPNSSEKSKLVQNASARLVNRTRDHITPILSKKCQVRFEGARRANDRGSLRTTRVKRQQLRTIE